MERKKVIDYKYLPTQFPVSLTLLVPLVLDRMHAPGWLWGAAGFGLVAAWVGSVVNVLREDLQEPEWKNLKNLS